jgi:KRAB domain-containing zinc finger protein
MKLKYFDKLVVHIRTHTRIKPFQCKGCGESFTVRHSLQAHMQRHNMNKIDLLMSRLSSDYTRPRNFRCSLCSRKFFTRNAMWSHVKKHHQKSLECRICNARFALPSSYERHIKSHKGIPDENGEYR